MRLLDRYLLRELLLPFGYCLGGFLIFWISSDVFSNAGSFEEHKLNLLEILQYYVAKSPGFLSIVIPVAFLLALLYALTQHARYNEITAMRAAGLSLWRLAAPYFVVGTLASLVLLAINELWAADSEARADFILQRHSGAPPRLIRVSSRVWAFTTPAKTATGSMAFTTPPPARCCRRWSSGPRPAARRC